MRRPRLPVGGLLVGGPALVAAVVALVGARRSPSPAPARGSEQG